VVKGKEGSGNLIGLKVGWGSKKGISNRCNEEDDDFRIQLAKAGYERIQEFTWDRSTDLLGQFLMQHVKL